MTLAISGSEEIRLQSFIIAAGPSNIPKNGNILVSELVWRFQLIYSYPMSQIIKSDILSSIKRFAESQSNTKTF